MINMNELTTKAVELTVKRDRLMDEKSAKENELLALTMGRTGLFGSARMQAETLESEIADLTWEIHELTWDLEEEQEEG
jgi:hypothetical protein